MAKFIDLTGQTFGRLTVIEQAHRPGQRPHWLCHCQCGNEVVIVGWTLRSGHTRSCGCVRVETTRQRMTTHGATLNRTRSPENIAWKHMRMRCLNPRTREYPNYGGRGITICERWSTFENFLADMGPRPKGTSLDRIDNNGNYEPSNCRWATPMQQGANTRRNRFVMYQGEHIILAEAIRRSGISLPGVKRRIRAGWPEHLWFIPADPTRQLSDRLPDASVAEREP